MLTYILILGVGLLIWLAIRHINGNRAPILLGLMCALLLVGGVIEWRWRTMEDRYTDLSRELLGRDDTYVVCERMSRAMLNAFNRAGYVGWTADGSLPSRADLTWDTCRNIRKWEGSSRNATDLEQVNSLHVLTHEAMHLAGHYGEAEAECFAMQNDSAVAQLLGASPANGDLIARTYWVNTYPRMPDGYTSSECKESGAMDQTPDDGVWP